MNRHAMSLLGGALLTIAACSDPAGPPADEPAAITSLPRALTDGEQAIIDASGTFAFDLLREVNQLDRWRDKNVFLSPLSASMALGMTMNGAAGQTFDEMRQMLGFGSRPLEEINASYKGLVELLRGLDPAVKFQVANAIWYDRQFEQFVEPSFLSDVRTWFGAETGPLDMGTDQSVATINDWAKLQTNGLIDHVTDETDSLKLFLANATYFKGSWRHRFEKSTTAPGPFTTPGGIVDVATMYSKGPSRLGHMANGQVLELSYGGNAYAMVFVLPPSGETVDDFVSRLTRHDWDLGLSSLRDYAGELFVPKFTMAWEDTLNVPLQRLGMVAAFDDGLSDFSRMSQQLGSELYVRFVKQDTYVDVDEEGTEAAAVTTVGVGLVSLPPPEIRINRPFVFAIRERLSGTILFMGKIVDPRS